MHTTIKVSAEARDRLAQLAGERGTTIKELVEALASGTPTQAELQARAEAANAYVRAHLNPDLSDADLEAGERFWRAIESGRVPRMNDLYDPDGEPAA